MFAIGIGLALAASTAWGSADFLGGRVAQNLTPLRVALWSKVVGGVLIALLCAVLGIAPVAAQVPWAVAAGVSGSVALVCLYRALALGPMSLVAPLAACSAIVPVAVAVVRGELPGAVTTTGLVCAFTGAVVVARSQGAGEATASLRRDTLLLALVTAVTIGIALTCLQEAARYSPDSGASALGIGLAQTATTVALLALLGAGMRAGGPPGGTTGVAVAVLGVLDVGANALFASASTLANAAVVAVLGSLFPVVTLLLARVVLGERLTRIQAAGVGVALAGVLLIGAGG